MRGVDYSFLLRLSCGVLRCCPCALFAFTYVHSFFFTIAVETVTNIVGAMESRGLKGTRFVFLSAAEAGWGEMLGGNVVEGLSPTWLKRYLKAKREAERILTSSPAVSPFIFRPSIVYTKGDPKSFLTVRTFESASFLPFVDKPISVGAIAEGAKRILAEQGDGREGILRGSDITELCNL